MKKFIVARLIRVSSSLLVIALAYRLIGIEAATIMTLIWVPCEFIDIVMVRKFTRKDPFERHFIK